MQKTVTSIVSRRNCRFKSASLFRDSLNGQDTGSIEFKLFLNFSVCYTIKACIAECSYFDWSETFAIMVRGVQVQILRTVFDFITLYIFSMAEVLKNGFFVLSVRVRLLFLRIAQFGRAEQAYYAYRFWISLPFIFIKEGF